MAGTFTLPAAPQGNPTQTGLLPALSARAWWCTTLFACVSATVLMAFGPTDDQSSPPAEVVAAAQATVQAPQKPSVISHGIVEAIRELPAEAGSGERQFEMTIRMRDGTQRISNEKGSARWQAGDRVQLIGIQAAR